MTSMKNLARTAGFLYLLLALIGPFSLMVVPGELIEEGDAATTADNIMDSEGLFRAGLVGEAAIFLIEVVLVVLLYILLKPVDETLSLIAAFARLSMAIIQGINVLVGFAVLLVLSGEGYWAAFEPDQLAAMTMLLLDLRGAGIYVWQVFFGLHLLVLGYLFARSGYVPRILGWMVVVAGVGYSIQAFGYFVAPDAEATLEAIAIALTVIPEVSLTCWLLIRGVNVPPADATQSASS
jgi:hypothetical protein